MNLLTLLISKLLLFASIAIAVIGCSTEDHVGQRPNDEAEALTVTEALEQGNLGRSIRVGGEVAAVCQEEGCWMTITDETSTLRLTFKDGEFVVPISLTGTVVVEGVIREEIFDEESAKAVGRSIGMSDAEVDAMKGDQRLPLMTATGVLFVDEQ